MHEFKGSGSDRSYLKLVAKGGSSSSPLRENSNTMNTDDSDKAGPSLPGNGSRPYSPTPGYGLGLGFRRSAASRWREQTTGTHESDTSEGQSLLVEGVPRTPASIRKKGRQKSWKSLAPLIIDPVVHRRGTESGGLVEGNDGFGGWSARADNQDFHDLWEELEFSGHNLTSVLNNPRETFMDSLYEPFEAEQHYPLMTVVEPPLGQREVTLQDVEPFIRKTGGLARTFKHNHRQGMLGHLGQGAASGVGGGTDNIEAGTPTSGRGSMFSQKGEDQGYGGGAGAESIGRLGTGLGGSGGHTEAPR
ncbi:unnamed protein product [Choristocarpus tenellus]